ncbi:MAG: sulfatase [bacterium]
MDRTGIKKIIRGIFVLCILIFGFSVLDGCKQGNGPVEEISDMDFIDNPGDLGVPSDAPGFQVLQSDIIEMKLGLTTARAVAFPPQMSILVRLPRLPEGAKFMCLVGVDYKGESVPETRFSINRRSAQNVKTQLATLWLKNGDAKEWHDMEADLSRFSGQEITLSVDAMASIEKGVPFLANPRLVIPKKDPVKQVIVLCIDTLRTDHVGCFGGSGGMTPSLDKLAKEAISFSSCESACPWTLPSVAATITGKYPGIIAADSVSEHLRSEETTLAELFHEKGYRTASITNNHYVSAAVGFFQGNESQRESPKAPADEEVDAALEWIGKHLDENFYLYIHFFDPHVPYQPPEPYLTRFKRGSGRFEKVFESPNEVRSGELVLTDSEKEQLRGLYNGCVAFSDAELGRMIDKLKELNTWDNTMLVVFADHGEEFWEHGGFEHGHSMYDEVTRVPLFIKVPGVQPAMRSDRVSLIDVVPTIINWAGLSVPEGLNGKNILSPDYDQKDERRFFIEGCIHATESKAIVEGGYKQILYFDGVKSPELYNLDSDPGEKNNLVSSEKDKSEALSAELIVYSSQTGEGSHFRFYPPKDLRGNTFRVVATTENGVFKDWKENTRGEIKDKSFESKRLEVSAKLEVTDFLALDFYIEPEDAEVVFTLIDEDSPDLKLPWSLGSSGNSSEMNELRISMTDKRIAMSLPQARLTDSEGAFIWSVPPSVRAQFEGTLSPEVRQELSAVGYLH